MYRRYVQIPLSVSIIIMHFAFRLCEQHLHPIQNEIQDLGNTVVQVYYNLGHSSAGILYLEHSSAGILYLEHSSAVQVYYLGLRSKNLCS